MTMTETPYNHDPHQSNISAARLSISSHVVVQLGAELVTDVEQALLELAKNAYDADSDTCEIEVEPEWQISASDPAYVLLFPDRTEEDQQCMEVVGRLQIRDEGMGIPADAVEQGWLRISASLKRGTGNNTKIKTKKQRTPVGDKGLGRLATMKIGTVLRMKTSIEGETHKRTVSFSWGDFTPYRTLDQIRVLTAEDSEIVESAGTTIEIIGLHNPSQWRNLTFIEKELVPNLSSLISPFQSQDNFSITVSVGTRTFELETLQDEVLNLASAKFMFEWDGRVLTQEAWLAPSLFRGTSNNDDQLRFDSVFNDSNRPKFLAHLSANPRLRDRSATTNTPAPWLLAFSEKTTFETMPSDKDYPGSRNPGPFKAEIYSFSFNNATKQKLTQAGLSAAQMQAMANVALYRDGFRVRAQKDWLRLSESSTKGGSFYELRPSNVIGFFALSNEFNPGLVEKSDREGFVDNPELRGFMLLSQRCKGYANSILEATRRAFNEFAATVAVGPDSPPTSKMLAQRLESNETESTRNIARAKSTLVRALRDLSDAKTTLDLTSESSPQSKQTISLPLGNAASDLEDSLTALTSIEERLLEHARLAEAMKLLRLSDEEQRNRLIEAAAVGLTARSLSHELHHYVRQLRDGIAQVSERNKHLRDSKIRDATRLLNSGTRELAKLIATIDPLMPGSRSLKENFSLQEFLAKFVNARYSFARGKGINLLLSDHSGIEDIEVRFSRTRLLQVVENLFQNSIYWLVNAPITISREKQIVVEVTKTGFVWSDTGPGISPSLESSIFEAFVSDKPTSEGQGLGLHIAATFLEAERCSIQLGDDRNELGRRFKFVVTLSGATKQFKQPNLFPRHG